MPPRWPRKPDRADPAFRRLDDRMTFAVHVAGCIAVNSGIWFYRLLQQADWPWAVWFTSVWGLGLFLHAVYIFAIAKYPDSRQA